MREPYDICIVGGCGHVGLPLALSFADKGKRVLIYDINREAITAIESGVMPFLEYGSEDVLKRVIGKTLFHSSDIKTIASAPVVIVTIGTPVDEHMNPSLTPMMRFAESILPYLQDQQTLVMRSTVYPGTTENLHRYFKKCGKDVSVTFCPERIAQGYAMTELVQLPQIISSLDERGLSVCRNLFSVLTDEIIEMAPMEAELVKLFTNVWRYIKFAVSNQFYMIAQDYGIDFYTIHRAMTQNYPRAKDFPKAGFAAGPCLFKDTMQLAAFNKNNFFLGHAAMLINEGMPNYVVGQLKEEFDLVGLKVGILGMAFKGENDDYRDSLAFKLKKILEFEGADVICSDEYCRRDDFVSCDRLIEKSDIIVIGAPHRVYSSINYSGKRVFDVWGIVETGEARR